jgi:DNA-binding response OmpR family regulator
MPGSVPHLPPAEKGLLARVPDLVCQYRVSPMPGFDYGTRTGMNSSPSIGWTRSTTLTGSWRPSSAWPGPCRARAVTGSFPAGDLTVDLAAARAFVAGRSVELTASEHRILALLASVEREASREELVEHLWGSYHAGGERAVQVHVSNLRRKLDPHKAHPPLIETVRGVGYRLRGGRVRAAAG